MFSCFKIKSAIYYNHGLKKVETVVYPWALYLKNSSLIKFTLRRRPLKTLEWYEWVSFSSSLILQILFQLLLSKKVKLFMILLQSTNSKMMLKSWLLQSKADINRTPKKLFLWKSKESLSTLNITSRDLLFICLIPVIFKLSTVTSYLQKSNMMELSLPLILSKQSILNHLFFALLVVIFLSILM